jgi:hypothetical protein
MRVSLRVFWTPKLGNTPEEYEDSFWPPKPLTIDSKLLRFAVADGATETSFAASWAQILTRAYCRDQLSSGKKIRKQLPRLRREWFSSIETHSLPWYAEQKLNDGAFAALVGLTLSNGQWQATAIGDSCLFQVRGRRLLTTFPIANSEDFNNRPALLSSNSSNWQSELATIASARGAWEAEDVFYMMTDAMACWFLRSIENGVQPEMVFDCDREGAWGAPDAKFDRWIEGLRESGMRNDDVTLLRITVGL